MRKIISICSVLVLVLAPSACAMDKAEILDKIAKKTYSDGGKIGAVLTPQKGSTESDGAVVYKIVVREESGDYCQYRSVFIYVINEGKLTEKAFFMDGKGPDQTVDKNQ